MRITLPSFVLLFLFVVDIYAAKNEVDALLEKLDKVYRSNSSEASMKMTIKTPRWKRTLEMKAWTKGMERTFVTILSPRKEKGISTLKKDNEMWNYFPRVNKIIKIPPSMMMGSWMGSDFTNDDLVKENTYRDDFNNKVISKKNGSYTIELIPKKGTVTVWAKVVLVIDTVKLVAVKEDFFNEKGELVRSINFDNVRKVEGKFVPMKIILTSVKKEGHSTIIEYLDLKFDVPLKDSFFSVRNLQKRR